MRSMTGYGRATIYNDGREITLDARSVNHRYLDISFRMPRALSPLEERVRQRLSASFSRGHFDISVTYRNQRNDTQSVQFNESALNAYMEAFTIMNKRGLAGQADIAAIASMPGVFTLIEKEDDLEAVTALLDGAMDAAFKELDASRCREGDRLEKDIISCLDALETALNRVEELSCGVVDVYREKLMQRLNDLLGEANVDQGRVAQEIVMFADRVAIDEETVRLHSHIEQMRSTALVPACGKRLDFLLQEMNREANTITSKASVVDTLHETVEIKSLIERLREQVQNIE